MLSINELSIRWTLMSDVSDSSHLFLFLYNTGN